MFAQTQMGGLQFAFPDVCETPTPEPVPIPYPNMGLPPMGVPACYNILLGGTPAHNMATITPTTEGDEAGVLGGDESGTFKGIAMDITAAFTVLLEGIPATRMTSVTIQNTSNAVGAVIVPSQVKVLLLAP